MAPNSFITENLEPGGRKIKTFNKWPHHLSDQKKFQAPKNEIFHSKNLVSGTLNFF